MQRRRIQTALKRTGLQAPRRASLKLYTDEVAQSNVERLPVGVAPGEIASHFWDADHAQYLSVRREDMNPAGTGAEEIALDVDLAAVRHPGSSPSSMPRLAARYTLVLYLEPADVHSGGVVDEKDSAILSKAEAVRLLEILDNPDNRAVARIKPIHAANRLLFLARDTDAKQRALAGETTIGRVGESTELT